MPPRKLLRAAAALVALCLGLCLGGGAPVARADEVILKDGSVVRGEVLTPSDDEKAPLQVRVVRGEARVLVEVPRAEVRFVRRLSDEAERQLERVEGLLADAKLPEAIALLKAFVAKAPADARAQRELGFASLLAGDPQGAVGPLEEACRLDPLDLEAHLSLGRAQERLGRLDAAIETYRRAVLLGPDHADSFRRLAQLLLARCAARRERLGQPGALPEEESAATRDREEALRAYERATRVDPRDEGLALERASALLAGDERERGQAKQVLHDLLAKAPQAAGAIRMLAQLEAADGEPRKALLRLVELLKRRDLPPPLRERLEAEAALYGWLLDGRKTPAPPGMDAGQPQTDLQRARLRLVFLLELLPEDGGLLLALARVELRDGELDEGRAWLDRAAVAGPAEVQAAAGLLQQVCVSLVRARVVPTAPAPETFFSDQVAAQKAKALVTLAPWLPAAHRTLGRALERDGDFKAAAQAYADGLPWSAGADKESLIKAAQAALERARRKEQHKDL
ncbi:MAG: tetratricopeptide repeat protein [Planctomycetota bacterium]